MNPLLSPTERAAAALREAEALARLVLRLEVNHGDLAPDLRPAKRQAESVLDAVEEIRSLD